MTGVRDILYFEFENNRLAYRRFGNGPVVLLAFHGFGQSSQAFESIGNAVGKQFTVLALDLFFHGGSYPDSNPNADNQLLTKTDWQRLIGAFLQARGIDRFALMGFSLGGRFALATAEAFSDRLDGLVLIAPDGITRSIWYRLSTHSRAGRAIFRYVLRHLSFLAWVGHALTRLGFLNRTAMRFAEISLGTAQQRRLVYQTWTQFRLIEPDLNRVSTLLNQRAIPVRLFVGAFDRIVPGHYILPLTNRLHRYELTVLKTGHNHIIDLTAEQLTQRPLNDLPKPDNRHDD